MRVRITPTVQHDLAEIAVYIAMDNPSRARSFAAELRAACHALGEMPERYPLIGNLAVAGVRRRAFGQYATLYALRDDRVDVLRILHGARDIDACSTDP